ncbi:MAG: hypothetical protein N2317_05505 [Syntrophales bacterium]|nr:hypothetical protein [Syntrophales bacterium]
MPLIVGGFIATVLGIIGMVIWWGDFITIIKGALPVMMILGGILAIYVGYDDLQEQIREERRKQEEKLEKAREEIETIKAEAERYREELERLREETKKLSSNNP